LRIGPTDIGSDLFGSKKERPEIASPALRIFSMDEQLELPYFDCRWSFGALLNFEADTITFRKAFEAGSLDGAMVNKAIFSVFSRDKAVTLLIVEPLYRTLPHLFLLPSAGVCV
jgi:hypothetical protein